MAQTATSPTPLPPAALTLPVITDTMLEAMRSKLLQADSTAQARIKLRMFRANCAYFASEVIRGPEEAPYNGKCLLGPHHVEWADALNEHSRILALAARDHGKSFFFVRAYALWMAAVRAPGKEGYVISATDQQAKDHLRGIVEEVIGVGDIPPNPRLAHLLPLRKCTEREVVFANGTRIKARGFGSKVRGGHPWWVVGDDLLNDEHVWSETVRKKGIDYFLSAIEPMPVPGGQLVVVGTPFHAEDLYAHLARNGVYHVMKHAAVDAVTGKALWPARYDEVALARKKRILANELRWSREYLCQPISDDSSLFPSWLFEQAGIKQPYALGLDGRHWQAQGFRCFVGVDLAISASAKADWFVIFILAVCPVSGDIWVVDILRRQGIGYQEQVDSIVSAAQAYDADFVFCEANQYQRVITDMVVRTSNVPIKAFYTTGRADSKQATNQRKGMAGQYSANKNALDRGVPALRMLLENRKLRIPWDESTRERVQLWLTEMNQYSFVEGKLQGVGAHDDTVLAFWMAERACKMGGGFAVHFDAEDEVPIVADGSIPTPMGVMKRIEEGAVLPTPMGASAPEEDDADAPDWFGQKAAGPRLPGIVLPDDGRW